MYLVFFIAWIIFNGQLTLEIAIIGLIVAAAVFAFACHFLDYSIRDEFFFWKNVLKGIRYAIILVIEIVKANFFVVKMVLTEREQIEPALVSFTVNLKNPIARAFLANAITLTPGTITVSLEDNRYTVHCLDKSLAEGMNESVFVTMLTDMELITMEQLHQKAHRKDAGAETSEQDKEA